jgi:hypothetical protein
MTTESPSLPQPSCTAFLGSDRIAYGSFQEVGAALAAMNLPQGGGLLVFDDATGALVDYPWPAGHGASPEPSGDALAEDVASAAPPSVGRPRLGVVAREVTLLPRHWNWLSSQRGGASAALRRLVEEARKAQTDQDAQREAKERVYRFMSAIGGGFPGFEEVSRALFANDAKVFADRIQGWPDDVKAHLGWMARDAFATV